MVHRPPQSLQVPNMVVVVIMSGRMLTNAYDVVLMIVVGSMHGCVANRAYGLCVVHYDKCVHTNVMFQVQQSTNTTTYIDSASCQHHV